jgi:hypothetical protein
MYCSKESRSKLSKRKTHHTEKKNKKRINMQRSRYEWKQQENFANA